MYKLIDSSSFFSQDEVQVSVVDLDTKSLTKQAADSRVQDYVKNISPVPGKMYLHINAMGAGEYYGANKNADYFPEGNLLDYYKTFETSPAHVFRHHINKDPARSIGKVLFSVYNERMHRVELITEVDSELGKDIEDKIAMGMYPSTSMACKTPYDVCSICGNKAATRQEYCSHLTTQLGRQLPDGRKVMALNVGPLKFFDISIVIKPADITSSILQKVASETAISSVDMAEEEGLSDSFTKSSAINKLSEFIKNIEDGEVMDVDPLLQNILDKVKDPGLELLDALKNVPTEDILSGFISLGMSPSLEFLAEMLARKTFGDEGKGLGIHIRRLVDEVGAGNLDLPKEDFSIPVETPSVVLKTMSSHMASSSLLPEFVEKRASILPNSGQGYAVLGQGIIPSANDLKYQSSIVPQDQSGTKIGMHEWIAALLGIGGAALLAKWFITDKIKEELHKEPRFIPIGNNIKIVLTKNASDSAILSKLSKVAMEQSVIGKNTKPREHMVAGGLKTVETIGSASKSKHGRIISVTAKVLRKARNLIQNKEETN